MTGRAPSIITPARLLPEASIERAHEASPRANGSKTEQIRGKALIFWDPKVPGKKLDAIDTDQITPATDCVSESLETLDARWKAGSFRFLMPAFVERVGRGENFVIAGDRFAIGSSREMSPAGLKGVGEEAGHEIVIVCGAAMGDIFRRNALNLGLHVIQSRAAVDDAQEGDSLSFDTLSRTLTNETRGKTYQPTPLSPPEEDIRRTGGIIKVGKREFAESVRRMPEIVWPNDRTARRMSSTEQIVWSHRVDKDAEVRPGATLRVYADLLPASDGTGPFSIHTFNQISGGNTIYPRQVAYANDHFVFNHKEADDKQTGIGKQFADRYEIGKPRYATPGDGIFHFYFPEQGLVVPGALIPGADSHSRAYGAHGALGYGVGSTTLGFGWATGYVYFSCAKQRRVRFTGKLNPWVGGKDVVLALLARWGAKQSQGMSVEFVDADRQLPMSYRNTIANMMAEGEATNGIFAPDETTMAWFASRNIAVPYPPFGPGEDVAWELDEELDLAQVEPLIAKPFSPANAFPASEVAKERLTFDKAFIGSCTNGGYSDLLEAALVISAAKKNGATKAAKEFVIFPGSGAVKKEIERTDPRLGGESIADVLRSVGAEIRESWCGPCFGQGPDALVKGETAITSFNRNWANRMGVGGMGYLASPAVVAASAMLGYMGPPSELGIEWTPERFV